MAGVQKYELKSSYFTSPFLDEWDYRRTVNDRIRELANSDPEKLAFVFREPGKPRVTLTRKEIVDNAERLARHFVNLGIKSGDKVAFVVTTGRTWVVSQFGLYIAGAIAINFSSYDPKTFSTTTKTISCVASLVDNIYLEENLTNENRQTFFELLDNSGNTSEKICIEDLLATEPPCNVVFPNVNPEAEIVMMFTSGSTGLSKLASLSHLAILSGAYTYAYNAGVSEKDVILHDRPMCWSGGYPLLFLGSGCTTVSTSLKLGTESQDDFFIEVIKSERALFATIMDYRINSLKKRPDLLAQIPFLSGAVTLGQRVSESAVKSTLALASKLRVMYGSTECFHTFGVELNNSSVVEEGIIGYPGPGCEAKVIDENGDVVPVDQEGELCIRGPACSKQYIFADGTLGPVNDNEGWFHSGDIVVCHSDGRFVVKGRKSEIIKRAAVKIFPAFIERALRENLDIVDVAVVGISDDILHQEVCACIIPKEQKEVTAENIKQLAIEIFKPLQAPDGLGYMPGHFVIMKTFPKLPSGKCNRLLLKQIAEESFKAKH